MPRAGADVEPSASAATLVFLPGMDGTGRLFASIVGALRPAFDGRVVGYPPDAPSTFDGHVAVARAALPDDRPCVIVAESFSGPIAITLAAEHPPGLRGLVLVATFASTPRPGLRAVRGLAGVAARVRPPRSVLTRALVGRDASPTLCDEVAAAIGAVTAPVLAERFRIVLGCDVRAAARAVDVPVLCLVATRDRVVPSAASEELARSVPRARVVPIDGPHLLLQARPTECARAISSFVAAIG